MVIYFYNYYNKICVQSQVQTLRRIFNYPEYFGNVKLVHELKQVFM